MVTGELGASAAGLRDVLAGKLRTRNAKIHLMPEAQVLEGEWLGKQSCVHAMCDISDGIASDLQHIIDASKKGVIVEDLPSAKGATWKDAFEGGEDYKLLITVDKNQADDLARRFKQKFGTPLYIIGKIKSNGGGSGYCIGVKVKNGDVITQSTGWGGYHHF